MRATCALLLSAVALPGCGDAGLTQEEKTLAMSMALSQAPPPRVDPSNAFAANPDAIALGQKLFFDTSLSYNGTVACASCHDPDMQFQDGIGLAVGKGTNNRRTMPLAGVTEGPWFFWDGRKDSAWSQALGPLENPVEHATDRTSVVRQVLLTYGTEYQALFGQPPALPIGAASPVGDAAAQANWQAMNEAQRDAVNRAFGNIGKSIAAFETTIKHRETKFDRFMESWRAGATVATFAPQEERGLKLFLGKGNCVSCHTGPRFTDDHFHNTGVPEVAGLPPDRGRAGILEEVKVDPFNCLGPFSDAKPKQCRELMFMSLNNDELERAYKVPSLRGVATRAPYMHAGQFSNLEGVLLHYSMAPSGPHGHSELKPLALSEMERADLIAFLKTLD